VEHFKPCVLVMCYLGSPQLAGRYAPYIDARDSNPLNDLVLGCGTAQLFGIYLCLQYNLVVRYA
jgi:hypothetical protein